MTTEIEAAGCATDEALARLWAHDLDGEAQRALRAHLSACPVCAERARRLADVNDTWVERLRSVGAPPRETLSNATALSRDAVPGYQIEGELARGGQGVVYRAVQTATRRVAALKVLRDGALASDSARRRFQREIELIAELRHPNLLTVYDAGVTRDGRAYFAMEFVAGQPLGRWIEGQSRLAPDASSERARLRPLLTAFIRICGAVGYAHQRGVIHRDLKPSNVLIDSAGEPRVVDFGLARWIAAERGGELTAAQQIAGTLPYMSPEQARGLPDAVDIRSDVYSLGVMLYEALTRGYPYPIESDTVATLRHIAETPPMPPRRRISGGAPVDDELETIMLKALAKERDRRYQSAGELGRDLERYLAGEPIEAKRDSTAYLLRKVLRRHRGLVFLSGSFVTTVTVLAIALAALYARQSHLRAVAEERYQQVRALARSFIFEFDPKIRRLPGSAEARRLVVEKGLAYLDILARDAPDDPTLLKEIGSGYMSIGDIQADATSSNLGQAREAVGSYRAAVAIFERLGGDEPERDAAISRSLVMARLRLVDALLGQNEGDAALRVCKTAYELTESLLRLDGNDEQAADAHVDAMERLGNCMVALGDRDGAASYYGRVMEISEARALARPDDLGRQRDLAVAYTKQAMGRYAEGDRPAALELYRRYVAIADRLLAASPEDVVTLRDAGVGYQWLGILELESQRAEDAIAPLQRSLELLERLAAADTANAAAALSLTATLTRLFETQNALGEFEAAEATARRNVEVSRGLVERSPDAPGSRRQYGVALYKLAEFHQAVAKRHAADDALRRRHQTAACERLEECHAWFVRLASEGKLDRADAGVPDELAGELKACRDAINASAPASGPAGD